jgi:hypothetical protein
MSDVYGRLKPIMLRTDSKVVHETIPSKIYQITSEVLETFTDVQGVVKTNLMTQKSCYKLLFINKNKVA